LSNTIAILLTIALLLDTAANVWRMWGVMTALRAQEEMFAHAKLETDKRIDAA
jgi:hypothetical protein